jgi:hypothetical protein
MGGNIMWVFVFLVLILSVLQLAFPAKVIMLSKRYQFREGVEPSDAAITMARVSAIMGIAASLVVISSIM